MRKLFILLSAAFLLLATSLQAWAAPLPVEKAFAFSARMENPMLLVAEWQIAPGYYLYKDKLTVMTASSDDASYLGAIHYPKAHKVYIALAEETAPKAYTAYEGHIEVRVPLKDKKTEYLQLVVKYQGCSQEGICYPPVEKHLTLGFPFKKEGLEALPLLTVDDSDQNVQINKAEPRGDLLNDQDFAKNYIAGHTLVLTLLSFLGLGLLLAFTPCSLPMIPILSSIIVGHKTTPKKALYLSLSYVLGSAVTYAIAGFLIAALGSRVQAYFQNAWVILAFSTLFVLLALSMLGLYRLQAPQWWQRKVLGWEKAQRRGKHVSVFLMGALSTLIVSPCVTAPLVGVLAYVSETGNLLLGASTLFALGLGMGIPLLIVGFSAGKYLPKAGPWMLVVERFFAFLLLGVAFLLLARILPGEFMLFLWACLFMAAAIYLFFALDDVSKGFRYTGYGCAALLTLYSFVLFVGVSMSYTSPLYPFETVKLVAETGNTAALHFVILNDMKQLDTALEQAKADKKPVVLDFYADWCESCRAVDKVLMGNPKVQKALDKLVFLRADVSDNNAFDQALLRRYNVIAPPTFLFFNRKGQEVMDKRIVGEVGHKQFLQSLSGL